jgi:hypothetical protein
MVKKTLTDLSIVEEYFAYKRGTCCWNKLSINLGTRSCVPVDEIPETDKDEIPDLYGFILHQWNSYQHLGCTSAWTSRGLGKRSKMLKVVEHLKNTC